jgi:hypothetical protein
MRSGERRRQAGEGYERAGPDLNLSRTLSESFLCVHHFKHRRAVRESALPEKRSFAEEGHSQKVHLWKKALHASGNGSGSIRLRSARWTSCTSLTMTPDTRATDNCDPGTSLRPRREAWARTCGRNATARRPRIGPGGGLFSLPNVPAQRCGDFVRLPDKPSAPLPGLIYEPDRPSAALPQPNRAPQRVCRTVAEPPSAPKKRSAPLRQGRRAARQV